MKAGGVRLVVHGDHQLQTYIEKMRNILEVMVTVVESSSKGACDAADPRHVVAMFRSCESMAHRTPVDDSIRNGSFEGETDMGPDEARPYGSLV